MNMIQANSVFSATYLVTFHPILIEIPLSLLLFIQVVSAICYFLWLRGNQQGGSEYEWLHLWFRYMCQTVICCWPMLLLMYLQIRHLPFSSTFVLETMALTGLCYVCSALWNIYLLTFSPHPSHPFIAFSLSLIYSDI